MSGTVDRPRIGRRFSTDAGETITWVRAGAYLDTASYGLPPDLVAMAVIEAVEKWQSGRSRIEEWIDMTTRARIAFASLIGAEPESVTISSTTSHLVGLVA